MKKTHPDANIEGEDAPREPEGEDHDTQQNMNEPYKTPAGEDIQKDAVIPK